MTHTKKWEGSEGNKYKLNTKKKKVWGAFPLALLGLRFRNDLVCEKSPF